MVTVAILEVVEMFHLHFFYFLGTDLEQGRNWRIYITIWCVIFAVLFGMFMRYIHIMNRTRKLDADVLLIDKLSINLSKLRPLYKQFCADKFALDVEALPSDLKDDIATLARDLSRVGALLQSKAFDMSVVFGLYTDLSVRAWFILELYLETERRKRRDPSWMWPLQYFAIQSLKFRFRLPYPELTIFDPERPEICKTYSRSDLLNTLHHLEQELRTIRPRIWRRIKSR